MTLAQKSDVTVAASGEGEGFVTAKLAGHWFALPISAVHEVFHLRRLTKVPQAPASFIGVLNLRGRIVTALDTRQLLGFPPAETCPRMAIGVERAGELFGLAVDEVGDVLTSLPSQREPAPANLDKRWSEVVVGVHRSDGNLLLIVAVERLFDNLVGLAPQ